MTTSAPGPTSMDDRFSDGLDEQVWTAAYLPAWSSRQEAAATWGVEPDGLHLSIPPDHPLWCADRHEEPMRVSAVQTGNWSGPVGSTVGQQPFRSGLTVREEQPARWGCTPWYGRVDVECRAQLDPASMFSAWMVGLEDRPERSGEICLVEVFGDAVQEGTVALGSGVHPFRDPALVEDFGAPVTPLDVEVLHRYAVEWRPGRVDFLLDGVPHRTVAQAPDYPVQLILAVFDFPRRRAGGEPPTSTPELVVRRVRVAPLDDVDGPVTAGP
jgi:hypothetical protein